MAVEDIKQVQDVIARESKLLVYTHFNMVVGVPASGSRNNWCSVLSGNVTIFVSILGQ